MDKMNRLVVVYALMILATMIFIVHGSSNSNVQNSVFSAIFTLTDDAVVGVRYSNTTRIKELEKSKENFVIIQQEEPQVDLSVEDRVQGLEKRFVGGLYDTLKLGLPPVNMNMTTSNHEEKTVEIVCLVTDKKYRKMGGSEGLIYALDRKGYSGRVSVRQVRLEDLETEGDFIGNLEKAIDSSTNTVLIHKYSDYYKMDGISRDQVSRIRNWLSTPKNNIRVLDDPGKIDVLSNRVKTGLLVRELCAGLGGFEARGLQWPEFQLKRTGEIEYPVIVKPVDACATDEAHWMRLVTEPNDELVDCEGCLIQKFHEHYGILYKVYAIGEEIEIVARPSISARGVGPVFRFNTHKFKAAEGELSLEKTQEATELISPYRALIEEFTRALKQKLKLTWFGADLIVKESEGGGVAVIDINYMPGFDGIRGLPEKLIKAILD